MDSPSDKPAPVMVLAQWTAHPARRRPQQVALLAAVLLFSTWAVLLSLQSFFLTGLAAAILLTSVAPFLLPTRYTLSNWGIEERRFGRRKRRPWQELRRAQAGPGAVLVSPMSRASWLDRYRGLVLYLDGADREQVLAIIEEHVGGH